MIIMRGAIVIGCVSLVAIGLALFFQSPSPSKDNVTASTAPSSVERPSPVPSPLIDKRPEAPPPSQPTPEPTVLRVANSYPNGGGFNWDSGSGTPEEIRFKGQRILSKAKGGTYCCGFTFAVVMRAAGEAGLLRDKSVAQVRKFQRHWYAATPEAREKQQIFALKWLAIGREVPLMEARSGDFIRLWHGGSGHSVILVRWIEENGRKIGLEYRGTQGSTDGIGNRIEYLPGTHSHENGDFHPDRTYAGRLNLPMAGDGEDSTWITPILNRSKRFSKLVQTSRHPAYMVEESGLTFWIIAIGDNLPDHFARSGALRVWRTGKVEIQDPVSWNWTSE